MSAAALATDVIGVADRHGGTGLGEQLRCAETIPRAPPVATILPATDGAAAQVLPMSPRPIVVRQRRRM